MKTKRKNPEKKAEGTDLPLFYAPGFLETLSLPEEESKHAIRVLRLTEGDRILVSDGAGALYRATIGSATSREVFVSPEEELAPTAPPKPLLRLAVAPTKNIDRIEWLLEKMVEVGLGELILLYTERTVRHQTNLERLEKVMISALKQSRKRFITKITERSGGVEALFAETQHPEGQCAYIGYCDERFPRTPITEVFRKGTPSLFLIGPEGDFTPEEVETAVRHGAKPVTLGDERLRTETAALYAGILHAVLNS